LLDAECGTLDYGIEEKMGTKMEGVEINTSESEHKGNLSKEKFNKEEAEGSLTQLIERSRKQSLETEKLETYRNIFASSEAEVQQQLQVVAQDVSSKDRNIAKWLGLSNQVFAVCVIRNVTETYDRIEYNIKEKIEICKEEEALVNGLDLEQKEKEEIEENKEVLIITECGVPDYGTEEIKDKVTQAKGLGLAKHDDLTEGIIANIKQTEVHSKMEVDINTDNKTEVVDKTSNEVDKVEDISSSIWAQASKSSQSAFSYKRKEKLGLTLWDVPTYTRAIYIKKALSFYGKVSIHGVTAAGKSKALYIELEPKDDRKAFFLQSAWAVHFEKGKMLRLTQGRFDRETLVKRSKFKAILKNVPKSTVESALLRQLKSCKAKAVYVSYNSNGNQRGTASIYFGSREDLDNALSSTV